MNPNTPSLKLLRRHRGYLPGIAPDTLLFRLDTNGHNKTEQPVLPEELSNWLNNLEISETEILNSLKLISRDSWETISLLALKIVTEVQTGLRLTLQHPPQCLRREGDTYLLVLPSSIYTWQPATRMLNACLGLLLDKPQPDQTETDRGTDRENEKGIDLLIQCRNEMQARIPPNANTLSFLSAAHDLDIPTRYVAGTLHHYGWGHSSALMDSSLTHATSAIGCNAARDKLVAKKLLYDAGLPVAAGLTASSASQAWSLAQKLGLPTVVKPQSADGGLEVHVKLFNQDEVEAAAEAIIKSDHPILVERYHSGTDYRLQVYRGRVFRCIERRPGGLTGDGKSTISKLLEELNRQPDRGPKGSGKRKRPIAFDMEAKRLLTQQGLSINSVPEKDQFIALRSAANVSRGGEMKEVMNITHPDNFALAARAAEALRLDLAGVDILMSDISSSWLDVGAIICEVNAQPQIASGHGAILQELIRGNGRIPVDVVLGLDRIEPLQKAIAKHQRLSTVSGLGLVGRDGVFVGNQRFSGPPFDQFQAVSMLLSCTTVDRLVLALWDTSILSDGLPIDRINRLATVSPTFRGRNAAHDQRLHQIDKITATLAPMSESRSNIAKVEDLLELLDNDCEDNERRKIQL